MQRFWIKQGDTQLPITATLEDADLSGASVRFIMRDAVGIAVRLDETATITNDTDPATVEYEWQNGETDVEGEFIAEFEVTFIDGSKMTYPNDGHIAVIIQRQLG